jgi:hypothetical protein
MKRSPLKRKTPMRRTPGPSEGPRLTSRKPMRQVSAKRRKRDAPYQDARRRVHERGEGRCEAPVHAEGCHGWMEDCHHRAGRLGPDPHRMANLVGLSRACHAKAHEEPLWAFEHGVSVRRNGPMS